MSTRARGFTLVELAMVVAVGLVLLAVLLPATRRARNDAGLQVSLNNLRQIMVYTHQYAMDEAGRAPMRGADYLQGTMRAWTSWHLGGRNCDAEVTSNFDWAYVGTGIFDERAFWRPLNRYAVREEIPPPEQWANTGAGPTWTFRQGFVRIEQRLGVLVPEFRSPGDKISYQGNASGSIGYGQPHPRGRTAYVSVGTSYLMNAQWWRYVPQNLSFTQQYDYGSAAVSRLLSGAIAWAGSQDFVFVSDQHLGLIASGWILGGQPVLDGEFGGRNRSAVGYIDGRASYIQIVRGQFGLPPVPSGPGYTLLPFPPLQPQ